MNITAVTISRQPETIDFDLPFYCHTEGYRPIHHRDNESPERIQYLTRRYTDAVNHALGQHPETEHIMIIDSYYLHQSPVRILLSHYSQLENSILGASIWFHDQTHLRPYIIYYETLSVRELAGKRWKTVDALPSGLIEVGAVGACWIFPRKLWRGEFNIVKGGLVNSTCVDNDGCQVLLDCDVRLWRSAKDGSGIPAYSILKRLRVSAGEQRRKILGW